MVHTFIILPWSNRFEKQILDTWRSNGSGFGNSLPANWYSHLELKKRPQLAVNLLKRLRAEDGVISSPERASWAKSRLDEMWVDKAKDNLDGYGVA